VVGEPEVVFVAVVSAADAAEPLVSGDIPVPFDAFVPAPVVLVESYNPEHSRSLVFANIHFDATLSNGLEVVDEVSVRTSRDARANRDPCSILSSLGLY
jgi:hypothetical protein